jgi:hypothetical protein
MAASALLRRAPSRCARDPASLSGIPGCQFCRQAYKRAGYHDRDNTVPVLWVSCGRTCVVINPAHGHSERQPSRYSPRSSGYHAARHCSSPSTTVKIASCGCIFPNLKWLVGLDKTR